MLVPQGCAHGLQTLTGDCEVLYFHTAAYQPAAEAGVHACDPLLAIRWPEEITELSARDAAHPMLTAAFRGVAV